MLIIAVSFYGYFPMQIVFVLTPVCGNYVSEPCTYIVWNTRPNKFNLSLLAY